MTNNYYQKHKKDSKKKHVEDIKIFLMKKKTKCKKRLEKDIKILLKKKRKKRRNKNLFEQKLFEFSRNYYLTYNKQLLIDFLNFLKDPGIIKRIH